MVMCSATMNAYELSSPVRESLYLIRNKFTTNSFITIYKENDNYLQEFSCYSQFLDLMKIA